MYSKGKELWKSTGIVIRGVITQALQKTEGVYAGGKEPSEVDCECHVAMLPSQTMPKSFIRNDFPDTLF
jgi:hypothetical protein